MTPEQRQAISKFVDAYFGLRDFFEADTYAEEMRQIFSVMVDIVDAAPQGWDEKDERGRTGEEYILAAEVLLNAGRWDEEVEQVPIMQGQINALIKEKNDLVLQNAKYTEIIQDLQKYVGVKDDRQKEFLARILELENANAVLTSANTELRALNAQIREKNASLKAENVSLKAGGATRSENEELRHKITQMLFKFHPDRQGGDKLATEITKDLIALRDTAQTQRP